MRWRWWIGAGLAVMGLSWMAGCGPRSQDAAPSLTLYSGRSEDLIQPLLDRFIQDTGIRVQVRYGPTAEMAATILEEGRRSPADVFLAQDSGALGALARAGRLVPLPEDVLQEVPSKFRSPQGVWVGVSGRARVVVVNPERVAEDELPESVHGFTDPRWRGRVGWAPTNASFQAFVTAMRVTEGEAATRAWLEAMQANQPRAYPRNTAIVTAVAAGEVDVGLTNHYYLPTMQRERGGRMSARNHFLGRGTLVNVAGVAVLDTARDVDAARTFVRYLLSDDAQAYFAGTTSEYPLARAAEAPADLPPLDDLDTTDIDLSRLEDIDGTVRLLQELRIL